MNALSVVDVTGKDLPVELGLDSPEVLAKKFVSALTRINHGLGQCVDGMRGYSSPNAVDEICAADTPLDSNNGGNQINEATHGEAMESQRKGYNREQELIIDQITEKIDGINSRISDSLEGPDSINVRLARIEERIKNFTDPHIVATLQATVDTQAKQINDLQKLVWGLITSVVVAVIGVIVTGLVRQ